jgi:hypothetical protein
MRVPFLKRQLKLLRRGAGCDEADKRKAPRNAELRANGEAKNELSAGT